MKRAQICFIIVAAILLLSSCASGPLVSPFGLSEGKARLTDIQMPEYVREDLSYEVILAIDAEETPQIRRVCFRWLTEQISSRGPSVYCYVANDTSGVGTAGNADMGGPCTSWVSTQGPDSSPFCFESSDINTEVPGRLVVKIRPTGLNASYNMLEGQVEYLSKNGKVCQTNSVRTHVTVEK